MNFQFEEAFVYEHPNATMRRIIWQNFLNIHKIPADNFPNLISQMNETFS